MTRILNKKEVFDILSGATFLAAGGGGSYESGERMLAPVMVDGELEVTMCHPSEMGEDENGSPVFGIGSPKRVTELEFGPEGMVAFDMLEKMAFFQQKTISYLISAEYGGFNTALAMLVSIQTGKPFLDTDGSGGRAVPGLDLSLFRLYEIPVSPITMAERDGDCAIAFTKDPLDATRAEKIVRNFCQPYNSLIGAAAWICSKDHCLNSLAAGAYSDAEKVGVAIRNAKENKLDVVAEIQKVIGESRVLFRGKILKQNLEVKDGFDWGVTEIEGTDGKTYFIDFKNESMVVRQGEEVVITVPDMACCVDVDTYLPLTNTETTPGRNIACIAKPAHKNYTEHPRGFEIFRPYLEGMGYYGERVPY